MADKEPSQNEAPFMNREILEMFGELSKGQDRIEAQVKHTNGRVTQLERWKYIGIGATSVLTIVVVPILSWALYVLVNIQGQINHAVDQALSAYNIEK
jgi:uncharacterized membrane protein YukC